MIDITAYIIITKNTKDFMSGDETVAVLQLDEGHSRPYWEALYVNPEFRKRPRRTWVPEFPETILIDGFLMAAEEILAAAGLPAPLIERQRVRDLTIETGLELYRNQLNEAFAGYTLRVIPLPGSSVTKQMDGLIARDVPFLWFDAPQP